MALTAFWTEELIKAPISRDFPESSLRPISATTLDNALPSVVAISDDSWAALWIVAANVSRPNTRSRCNHLKPFTNLPLNPPGILSPIRDKISVSMAV